MGEAKRRRAIALANLTMPKNRSDELPQPGIFGSNNDFLRAKYYSDVIAVYVKKEEHEILVAFAREKRMPFMTFADHLEAMGRYLHRGGDVEKLIADSKKPQAQLEAEFKFVEIVREGMKKDRGGGGRFSAFLREGLHQLFPKATIVQIDMALKAGNTKRGFSAAVVIETMMNVLAAEPNA